jgi:glutaminyl-peptide cyclotransferase
MVSPMNSNLSWGVILSLLVCAWGAPVSAEEGPAAMPPAAMPAGSGVGAAAFAHLETLAALGPRPPGSPAAAEAASYLRARLGEFGLDVEEFIGTASAEMEDPGPPVPPRVLLATVPGASPDLVVLFARFDSERFATFPFVGANDGASGAAVLLEVAGALVRKPLPYTTWVAFLEGDRDPEPGDDPARSAAASRLLVSELERRSLLSEVRLAVYWNQVGDRDLTISRDLYSDRVTRGTFFRTAARLGFGAQFPASAPYDSLSGGHHAFWEVGMRRVVALVDDRFGGTEAPGVYWHTEEDTLEQCAAESLDAVVRVSEAGLRASAAHLAKIDAWSRRPIPPPEPSVASQSPTSDPTHADAWEVGP